VKWRKEPLIRDWRNRATIDPVMVRGWWRQWPSAVPGIVLGRNGLVVVDADRHGGPDGPARMAELAERLPRHPVVQTVSGGEHHYFRQPEEPVGFFRWPGGEVLGTTRFVVGYSQLRGPIPEFPGWLKKALQGKDDEHHISLRPVSCANHPNPRGRLERTQSVPLRSRYLLGLLERAAPGNRNNLLHWVACRFGNMIGEGKINPNIAGDLLISGAKGCGLWAEDGPAACIATIRSGLEEGVGEWAREAEALNGDVRKVG
jgi:Bifunctional DNA primase/polymerase, N-terminal